MALLFDILFSSVALSHMIVDVLNGQRAVLLTFLSGPLGLSNALLGLVSTLYVMTGSLSQPVFGFITDRIGPRWVIAGGVLWMAFFFMLAATIPGTGALWFLILASLGSAAFHPAGTMQATLLGRIHFTGRETTSAAYFFMFGQFGYFLGPIVGGPILDRFGPVGLLPLGCLALPIGLNAAYRLRPARVGTGTFQASTHETSQPINPVQTAKLPKAGGIVKLTVFAWVAFILIATFQSWAQQNMITFVPKYLADLGQSASTYGVIAAIFMGGSAVGNAVGGNLADRFGKRRVAVIGLALASIPLFMVGSVGWSPWLFAIVPLAGALNGATYTIVIVLAQRLIPGGMGLAAGLILGFMFSSGALGTFISGFLADLWGFPPVFHITALLTLAAAALALSISD